MWQFMWPFMWQFMGPERGRERGPEPVNEQSLTTATDTMVASKTGVIESRNPTLALHWIHAFNEIPMIV